ncbi:MAG: GNAT family N-acetyltransferase [Chitinophagales bacterium]|nr:GNAT family N-acetyltransferase [Chitinophagales bacterium]
MHTPVHIPYNGYLLTTDKNLMQVEAIHKWLSEKSYWVKDIPFEVVKGGFDNSFCIGVLKDGIQVGYARLITDYTTIAYLADVYIEEEHRGQGLSKKMMEILLGMEWVTRLRKIFLGTLDAHSLYTRYGFEPIAEPTRWMEISRPGIYLDE